MGTGTPTFVGGTNSSLPGVIAGYAYGTSFLGLPSPTANDGSNSTTGAYNFGAVGDPDRALGGIAGTQGGLATVGKGYIAIRLKNTSGAIIKNLDIRYAMEQWYNSSKANEAYFRADYRVYSNATTVSPNAFTNNDLVQAEGTNNWTDLSQLDLQAPGTGNLIGQSDGNSSTYRRAAQHRLVGLNLANNAEIVIRFTYVYSADNGNGISLDDIAVYPETNVLYSNTNGNLNNASAWSQSTTSAIRPSSIDFTGNTNYTYYVRGDGSLTDRLTGIIDLNPTSRIVVGASPAEPATLYMGAGDQLTGTVDVTDNSKLQLGATPTSLKIGDLGAGSTVEYLGNSGTAQNVLPATYAKLNFSGQSPKALVGATIVSEALTLTSSTTAPQAVQLGDYNLTLLRAATLTRTNGGQIVTNGLGEYRATLTSTSGTVLFPVATSGAAADYLPASITPGSSDKDETFRVRVISEVFASYSKQGVASNPVKNSGNVNNTWLVGRETTTPVSITLKLAWTPTTTRQGAAFDKTKSFIDHFSTTNNSWDRMPANVSAFTDGSQMAVQRVGISNFSPFAVTSNGGGVLPVELTAFNAARTGTTVSCTWATASEKNNEKFVVERSLDAKTFQAIGTVEGAGTTTNTSNYSFVDQQPTLGINYYRLRQVDTDGEESFSPVVAVKGCADCLASDVTVAPNPGTGRFELYTNWSATTLTGTVTNTLGAPIITLAQTLAAGPQRTMFDLSQQPVGVYFVHLQTSSGTVVLKVIKE
ncbi:T9SS type A sorting domain-containing protein [Hymenobacter cavernae]|uniref:T9SS C-terminal target domain-containing protein n=1 Tax=Hymenobacter cavernae TaxID=2044852 RepID=A0ABQ1TRC4_9BACT|nr:T9SS type A sorting domain-containing protein [Hymenobacter cavernae]GGF00607.1 hypothetical protein GCM10011383_09270 [Hymenobacter cavernae]